MYIQNPIIEYIFNKLDFPIRWVYCRLPEFIRRLFFGGLYQVKFDKLDERFEQIKQELAGIGFSLQDKVCLELGPGNSYFNAYHFLIQGAKKVLLVDKYPRYSDSPDQQAVTAREFAHIKQKFSQDDLPYGSESGPNPAFIRLLAGDIVELEIPDPVDFVYSHHVLEHVKSVSATLEALSRSMRPGAVAYHVIDLRDHYNFNTPFLFYKYSPRIWEDQLTKEGVSYTNRLRIDDLVGEMKQAGFQILKLETEQFPRKTTRLADIFVDKDEQVLSTGRAIFLLRKEQS